MSDLDFPQEPNFPQRVIEIILQIPYGRVTTYGAIAVAANSPRSARLVGGVLHFYTTEKGVDLPWQRIVNRQGFISTRCLEHPKALQKALLKQEGVEVSEGFMVDLKKFGWWPAE